MVITGDISQIDFPKELNSGLAAVSKILTNLKGISFVHLQNSQMLCAIHLWDASFKRTNKLTKRPFLNRVYFL